MGDRCYLQVTVREGDEAAIEGYLGDADSREEEGTVVTLTYEQANYGLGNYLEEAADGGLEFYGFHGTGSSYDAAEFCSAGNTVIWIYTGTEGGYIINGETHEQRVASLARLEECLSNMNFVKARINNPLCALALEANTNV